MHNLQVVYQMKLLVYRSNSALYLTQIAGTQAIQSTTQYSQFTGGRKQGSIQQSDQRAFPSATWTDQSNSLSSLNFKIKILQGRKFTKFPADMGQFKDGLIAYFYDRLP
jgi:hypothetical protein